MKYFMCNLVLSSVTVLYAITITFTVATYVVKMLISDCFQDIPL